MNKLIRSSKLWLLSILLLVAGITANSFMVFETIDEMADIEKQIENTDHIVDSISRLHVAILTVESGQRGFLLQRDKAYLEHYTQNLNNIVAKIDTVEALRSIDPAQQQKITTLVSLTRKKLDEMVNTVELARKGDVSAALSIVDTEHGLHMYQQLEDLFSDISAAETQTQLQHRQALNKVITESKVNFLVSSGIVIALLTVVFLLMYYSNREQMMHQIALQQQNNELEDTVHKRTLAIQIYSDELARSNRELEDFAFVASHDLQEPLRKIRAFGDRLRSGYSEALDERGQDFLQRMLNAAERMSTLISDLLEFSRVSTRGKPFVQTPLSDIVAGVLDDLEIAIEEQGATVTCDQLPVIDADPTQMSQLFLNLISNALKFQRKGIQPIIHVFATPVLEADFAERELLAGAEYFDIHIEDNGIGFEPEYEEKIFAPFQRLHGRSEYAGTGIGLAVCRRIVERHNGQIRALGRPGSGATFIITIPNTGQPFASEAKMELENADE